MIRRTFVTLALSLTFAATAFAQTADPSAEFGRASGGDIDLITKRPQQLSGSLGISTSRSGSSRLPFDATLGGTLVKDRVWFFASSSRNDSVLGTPFRSTDAKLNANLGDRQALAASFISTNQSAMTTSPSFSMTANPNLSLSMPTSFLSLHYTGIVSPNTFVTASFSELKR
jgi:hypothetical protein